jgi:hypothetical protein
MARKKPRKKVINNLRKALGGKKKPTGLNKKFKPRVIRNA